MGKNNKSWSRLFLTNLNILLMAMTSVMYPLKSSAEIRDNKVKVHGHRGARWERPENTWPSFKYALDNGADAIELDLGVTKDNVLVIYHDQYLNPEICQYKSGKPIQTDIAIHSLTLREIKQFDCGSKKNVAFEKQIPVPGAEIPTFEEFLKNVLRHPRGGSIRFDIEAKSDAQFPDLQPEPNQFARQIITTLKKNRVLSRSTLLSFDYRILVEAKKIDSGMNTTALVEERPQKDLVEFAKEIGVNRISPEYSWLTQSDVKSLHDLGLRVVPWTVNNEESWIKLINLGVDGIITDDPKGLSLFLQKIKNK